MSKNPTQPPLRSKRTIAVVSTTAMAAGMAQGAIHYTQQNLVFPCPDSYRTTQGFDITGDSLYDFFLGFDSDLNGAANTQKPYVGGYTPGTPGVNPPYSAVLGRYSSQTGPFGPYLYGLPVAPFGTLIDASYLTPAHTVDSNTNNLSKGSFYQDANANTVGDWPLGTRTEGYVGVELYDSSSSVTNFGWLHIIYDALAAPRTLILVDSGYQDIPGVGIVAGSTNTVGAPIIYSEPASQMVPWGANVQLKVVDLSAPAPGYQWKARGIGGAGVFTNLTDSGVISGSTTPTLTINGATASNVLEYTVVITNSLGAATSSPPATLTLAPPPVTPTPQVLFGGLTAQFNVSVANGISPTYRWRRNGTNLSDDGRTAGSTTTHLQLSNLQTSDGGSYDVVVTLGGLSVTSAVSALTVLPAAAESIYQTALLAAGPWAYYPLNETGDASTNNLIAYDSAAAYNGIYGTNVSNGFNGVAGPRPADGFPGFAANNTAASFSPYNPITLNPDPYCRITLAPWNLNTDTATMLAWVNPADQQAKLAGVVVSGYTSAADAGIVYSGLDVPPTTLNRDVGYIWEDITSSCYFYDSQLFPPLNQWSMVAAVITPRKAIVYLFITNGVSSGTNDGTITNSFNPFTNQVMPFAQPGFIGTDPDETMGRHNFFGAIDEVAIFKKALTQDQLQSIFNAALGIAPPPPVTLQIARVGANVQLTWPRGTLLEAATVKGPWTTNSLAASPYTVPPTNSSKFYRVQVQ